MTATTSLSSCQNVLSLEAHSLNCIRGEKLLFSNLHFSLHAGQGLHVRGENGAGKTSLLRLLTGLAKPESGEVLFSGISIAQASESYRRNVLFMGHRDALKEDLTALENLEMYAALDGIEFNTATTLASLRRFNLKGREDLPVSCLSAGQKKRLLMARMTTRKAVVWILDEPFNGLDLVAVKLLQDLLAEQLQQGGIIILTGHQVLQLPQLQVLDL